MKPALLYRKLLHGAHRAEYAWNGSTDSVVRGVFGVGVTVEMLRATFTPTATTNPASAVTLAKKWFRARAAGAKPFHEPRPPTTTAENIGEVLWVIKALTATTEYAERYRLGVEDRDDSTNLLSRGDTFLPELSTPRERPVMVQAVREESYPLARDLLAIAAAARGTDVHHFLHGISPVTQLTVKPSLSKDVIDDFVVRVSIKSTYKGPQRERSGEEAHNFGYDIQIENLSSSGIRPKKLSLEGGFVLISRHWLFVDAETKHAKEVAGHGVVGESPVLYGGEKHRYSSSVTTKGAQGYMIGKFVFAGGNNIAFQFREALVGPIPLNALQ